MKTHQDKQSQLPAAEGETSQPNRRGLFAGLGAFVAGGLGLFGLQAPAKADDDDDWDDDDGHHGGYYYDPYYGGYDDDDDWDDDDGWDDDDWD